MPCLCLLTGSYMCLIYLIYQSLFKEILAFFGNSYNLMLDTGLSLKYSFSTPCLQPISIELRSSKTNFLKVYLFSLLNKSPLSAVVGGMKIIIWILLGYQENKPNKTGFAC